MVCACQFVYVFLVILQSEVLIGLKKSVFPPLRKGSFPIRTGGGP